MTPAASVALSVSYDPRAMAGFAEVARLFPKEVDRAHGQAASIVARKIRAAVAKAGNAETGGLAPHSPLRAMLWPAMPYGGVYASRATQLCRVQRRGAALHAGYVSAVEGGFSRWQEGGTVSLGTKARAAIRRRLAYGGNRFAEVPETATQPARPVVPPIHAAAVRDFPRWVESAALKLVEKTLARHAGKGARRA